MVARWARGPDKGPVSALSTYLSADFGPPFDGFHIIEPVPPGVFPARHRAKLPMQKREILQSKLPPVCLIKNLMIRFPGPSQWQLVYPGKPHFAP